MKKYTYVEIESDIKIHPGIAIAQGIQLLDIAATIATDTQDIDRMVKISSKWLAMGERLAEIMEAPDEEDEAEEVEIDKPTFGFSGTGKQVIERKEDNDDSADN